MPGPYESQGLTELFHDLDVRARLIEIMKEALRQGADGYVV
jgi:hypothetical protein